MHDHENLYDGFNTDLDRISSFLDFSNDEIFSYNDDFFREDDWVAEQDWYTNEAGGDCPISEDVAGCFGEECYEHAVPEPFW